MDTMKEPMKLDLKAPHQKYYDAAGKLLPGVTTVLGVLGKDALMPWAAKMEREGIIGWYAEGRSMSDLPKPYFYAGARDKAADLGTITHARVEAFLHGTTLDPSGLDEALYGASLAPLERFQKWWGDEGLTLVATELQLSHPTLGYGGTLDFVARDGDGLLVLGDIKTTGANKSWPYPNVIAQVAAYSELYEANKGERPARHVVVRVGKEAGDMGQQVWLSDAKVQSGMALFLAAQAAYAALKRLS